MSSGGIGVSGSDNGKRRRVSDARRHRRAWHWLAGENRPHENRYRDVLLLVAIGVALWGVWVAQRATDKAGRASRQAVQAVHRVQEGRGTSITITCAVLSGVSQAGEAVIKGPPPAETPFTRFLEQHGYPPAVLRSLRSDKMARAYVADIDRRVKRELAQLGKRPPPGLIRPDGTINCKLLQQVSAVPNPR